MEVISDSEYLQAMILENANRLKTDRARCKELRHFLEVEIERTRNWQEDGLNPFYDGVCVGVKSARTLRRAHIRFCERLLSMIEEAADGN